MNLTEDKKKVLRVLPDGRKWQMLIQHLSERYRSGPQEIIQEIQILKNSREKSLLSKLVVSLRSRPIRWISGFIDYGGLSVLLDYLNEVKQSNVHDEYEELYIKCLKSLMNNKIGLSAVLDTDGALNVIALSLRSPSRVTRSLILEIFGAVCLIPQGHETVLESLDFFCETERNRFRFEPIVNTLWQSIKSGKQEDKDLQVASMSFINAVICGGPGEALAFRMHMRWEFIQLGLLKLIDRITLLDNEVLQTQIDVFLIEMENDEGECFANLDSKITDVDMELASDLTEALNSSLSNTSCEGSYVSILKHLAILPHSPIERY